MEQLKVYLQKLLTGSLVSGNIESEPIKVEVEKLLEKPFQLDVFKLASNASIETISDLIKGYYFNKTSRLIPKCIDLKHSGLDLSFEKEKEKVFVSISPFTDFFKITVITFEK